MTLKLTDFLGYFCCVYNIYGQVMVISARSISKPTGTNGKHDTKQVCPWRKRTYFDHRLNGMEAHGFWEWILGCDFPMSVGNMVSDFDFLCKNERRTLPKRLENSNKIRWPDNPQIENGSVANISQVSRTHSRKKYDKPVTGEHVYKFAEPSDSRGYQIRNEMMSPVVILL